MKGILKIACLAFCFTVAMTLFSCSNGSDGGGALLGVIGGGGTTTTPETDNGGGTTGGTNPTTPTPTPAVTYVITFNANDGSENPATVTQNFTAGIAQALIPVEELGFSKAGFSFAGWGRAPKSKEASYADGASYTATANETLYALWSEIPVYSVNIPVNEHGTVTASPATGTAGTEITLSNTSNEGYQFISYTVTDANGGSVTVTNGKFTMPAKNVTVTAVFTALTYTITFNANDGSPSPATATQTFTAGIPQALKTNAELGFKKEGFNFAGWLTADDATEAAYADGASYTASANATLWANWSAIPVYSVNIPVNEHGTVAASPATATAGTEITLSNTPNAGYNFTSYTVTDADGGTVAVVNGKFTMPAKNVTVTATFSAINYNVNVGTFSNGSVTANPATATVGTSVTLTASPAYGYKLAALTVTAEGGASVSLSGTGNSRTFTMPAKNVTVTATFNALPPAASGDYTKIGTTTINGAKYDLVTFGLWPQTIMAADVTVDEANCQKESHGTFTYCKGSDGQWYVKQIENAYESGYKYSDGTDVAQGSANSYSYKWFKVEPIKWRVLTTNYGGKKLLLAENILTNSAYYVYAAIDRTIGGNTIYSNNYEHSRIRAFLNGLSFQQKTGTKSAQTSCDEYLENGFLQRAFTVAQQDAIKTTSVDNSAGSTGKDSNQYACDPTSDKIFLLSAQEYKTRAYGCYFENSAIKPTIKQSTDFAKAAGVPQGSSADSGGSWWLRSPYPSQSYYTICVRYTGVPNNTQSVDYDGHRRIIGGVVPALCVSN